MSGLRRVGEHCELGKQCLVFPSQEMTPDVKLCWRATIASGMKEQVTLEPPCPLPDVYDEPVDIVKITRSNGVDFASDDRRQHEIIAPEVPENMRIIGGQDTEVRNLGANS